MVRRNLSKPFVAGLFCLAVAMALLLSPAAAQAAPKTIGLAMHFMQDDWSLSMKGQSKRRPRSTATP